MSEFATWSAIIWGAPFVWFVTIAALAFVCDICEQVCENVSDWRYERRKKREADKKRKEKK